MFTCTLYRLYRHSISRTWWKYWTAGVLFVSKWTYRSKLDGWCTIALSQQQTSIILSARIPIHRGQKNIQWMEGAYIGLLCLIRSTFTHLDLFAGPSHSHTGFFTVFTNCFKKLRSINCLRIHFNAFHSFFSILVHSHCTRSDAVCAQCMVWGNFSKMICSFKSSTHFSASLHGAQFALLTYKSTHTCTHPHNNIRLERRRTWIFQ